MPAFPPARCAEEKKFSGFFDIINKFHARTGIYFAAPVKNAPAAGLPYGKNIRRFGKLFANSSIKPLHGPDFNVSKGIMEQLCFINWPELKAGTLVKRYKRFLADIRLESGEIITAHCPNSGSMAGCSTPGRPVYFSESDNPKRKLKYTWELIEMPESVVGVNTLVPNRLIRQCAEKGAIPELTEYDKVRSEVRAGAHTRFDLMLEAGGARPCYVEIKNCTLVENGNGCFPDAKTKRGRSHLEELQRQVKLGHRCIMFYLIQRMDACSFMPADHIDPEYGRELRKAVKNGVEILVYDTEIDTRGIRLRRALPWRL